MGKILVVLLTLGVLFIALKVLNHELSKLALVLICVISFFVGGIYSARTAIQQYKEVFRKDSSNSR